MWVLGLGKDKEDKLVRNFKRKRDRRRRIRYAKKKFVDLLTPIMILRLSLIVVLVFILSLTLGRELLTSGEGSLYSFVIVHFSGYLFFFLLPVEGLIPYYYSLGYSFTQLFTLAIFTAVAAELIDYGIGRLAPNHITRHFVGEKRYQRIQKFVDKYGGMIVFIFNLFPLSSSVLSAIAGVLEYNFWRWLFYSTLGLFVKYSVILFVLVKWF
ncbi:hypothetical protein CL619_04865 [archaeon]|nr:hypothetical protein [archaeon]|tara:strand:+ start:1443 stop:2075 length:633 start_codon:yes stop_codon:yes gene_type:complete